MRDWLAFSGNEFEELVRSGEFPEYAATLMPDGSERSHNNPYHMETLLTHCKKTIDYASWLAEEYLTNHENKQILLIAATWHDVGKMISMVTKVKWICRECGWIHHKEARDCEKCACWVKKTTVTGYHGHAQVGASKWVFRNIALREQIPPQLAGPAARLIENHSNVSALVVSIIRGNKAYERSEVHQLGMGSLLLTYADKLASARPTSLIDEQIAMEDVLTRLIKAKQ